MSRDITITFDDGTSHVYRGAPDDVTPDAVEARATKEFGKKITALDGGRGAAAPKSLVDQIPGMPQGPIGTPTPAPGIGDRILGALETPLAVGTGLVSGAVAPVVGLAKAVTGGNFGTQEGVRQGVQAAQQFGEQYTYRPRTQTGNQLVGAVNTGMANMLGATPALTQAAPLSRPVAQQLAYEADIARTPVYDPRAAAKPTLASTAAWENAAKIDAANEAARLKLVINPAESNPTKVNRLLSSAAGGNLDEALSRANEKQIVTVAKNEMGIPVAEPLSSKAYANARSTVAADSYDVIKKLPTLSAADDALAQLEALRTNKLIGASDQAASLGAEQRLHLIRREFQRDGHLTLFSSCFSGW